jgi:hypothetical protein
MKRTLVTGLFGLGAAALLGCPVFSNNGGGGGGSECETPASCLCGWVPSYEGTGPGAYCNGYCAPCLDAGFDSDVTDAADCRQTGCPSGSACEIVDAALGCVPLSDAPVESGRDGQNDAPNDAPSDKNPDATSPFTGCTSNVECSTQGGTGSLCLDGTCVAAADQCTDGTQCPGGEQCVQGACVPSCSSNVPEVAVHCPSGYACTILGDSGAPGVCTGNPTPCGAADGGAACTGDTTCVEEHCVPRCASGDAACGAGLVCVDKGCIPDQKPVFVCNVNGVPGDGAPGECATGSICLHHSCYFNCAPDASASDASNPFCSQATGGAFPQCKSVTSSGLSDAGQVYVCGSSSNLGSECSPTSECASPDICIDGYCR